MDKREELMRHYEKLMKEVPAAPGASCKAPASCRRCPYFRPEFKYRSCLYARCPYGADRDVFRKKPHKRDMFS